MFICELCAKPFSQKQHLNRHVNIIHNEVKRFKCKLCSAKFSLKEHLKRHHIAKHAHLPITLKKGSKPEILHKKAFECCKCEDKIFGSNWELKRHESICHSLDLHCPLCKGKEGTSPRAVQPHDPNIIVLQSKAIWEAHMDWHRGLKPYLCEVCLTAYETVQALNIHTSSKHTQIKLLKCLHCHEQFSHRNQISRHFRNVHSIEEQNLDCAFCSCPCTVTSGQYLDHIRLYHPEDKCRVCVYCLQEFDSYSQCQKHVLITHYTK